jgi:hypothetical protein
MHFHRIRQHVFYFMIFIEVECAVKPLELEQVKINDVECNGLLQFLILAAGLDRVGIQLTEVEQRPSGHIPVVGQLHLDVDLNLIGRFRPYIQSSCFVIDQFLGQLFIFNNGKVYNPSRTIQPQDGI